MTIVMCGLLPGTPRCQCRGPGALRLLAGPTIHARFDRLSVNQRHLYVGVILLSALATAQLSAPVAYHRLVFRSHRKAQLLRTANVLALTGLATVALSISGALLLVADAVVTGMAVPLVFVVTIVMFVGLWVVLPVTGRHRSADRDWRGLADGE